LEQARGFRRRVHRAPGAGKGVAFARTIAFGIGLFLKDALQ
jgi:hypothetical protein